MALDSTTLGSNIVQALQDGGYISADSPGDAEKVWQTIADELIKHFESSGEVTVTCPDGSTCTGTIT